jgi:hypothetical protein
MLEDLRNWQKIKDFQECPIIQGWATHPRLSVVLFRILNNGYIFEIPSKQGHQRSRQQATDLPFGKGILTNQIPCLLFHYYTTAPLKYLSSKEMTYLGLLELDCTNYGLWELLRIILLSLAIAS